MRTLFILSLALIASVAQTHAQTPRAHATQYVHTVWRQHEGVPLGNIGHIWQTSDGYLWMDTNDHGLLRFDGMRFTEIPVPCVTNRLNAAESIADGGFWAACRDRLLRYTPQGQFVVMPQPLPHAIGARGMLIDARGRLWFFPGPVWYLEADGTGGRVVDPSDVSNNSFALDVDGAVWIARANNEVIRIHESEREVMALDVRCLAPARDGGVYAANRTQFWHLRKGQAPSPIAAPPGVTFYTSHPCMTGDADGEVWLGTHNHGIAVVRNGRIETLAAGGDRTIGRVFHDREGLIWATSASSLHRFRKPVAQTLASTFFNGNPNFVFVDSQDRLWTTPIEGAGTIAIRPRAGEHETIEGAPDFDAVGEDGAGRIWLSNGRDIGYIAKGRFVPVRDAANAPIASVWQFSRDTDGRLFALAQQTGVYLVSPDRAQLVIRSPEAGHRFAVTERFGTWIARRNGVIEQHVDGRMHVVFDEPRPARQSALKSIVEDGDSMWVGTFDGLRRWRNGRWTHWTREHGLPGEGIVGAIAADRFGRLWAMTHEGLIALRRQQLDETPDGAPSALSFARLGGSDGIVAHPGNLRGSPHVSRDHHGRLYFTTIDTVVGIDPGEVNESAAIPPVVIENVAVDNRAIDDRTFSHSFIEPSRVQFDYTSLSLKSPENSRFRYQLEGYDRDWIDAGTERRVTYGTLPPGDYRFKVTATGPQGVWNDAAASFAFHVSPVFWRTWWFRTAVVACGSAMVVGLYQMRVRQLRRQFTLGLEARVAERTRIARELHDTLLQTFQGVLIHFQAGTNMLPGRPDDAKRRLENVLEQAAQAITEGRDAVQALRSSAVPSDDLADRIGVLAGQVADEQGDARPNVRVNVEGIARALRPIVLDDICKIAGEAMRNAMRHAHAAEMQIDIHYDARHLRLRVRDDGRGIDASLLEAKGSSGHWGLHGMRERAELIGGTLEVRSRVGSGTEIDLSIPASKAYAEKTKR